MSALADGALGFYGVVVNGVTQRDFALLVFDKETRPHMVRKDFLALGFLADSRVVVIDDLELVPLDGQKGMVVNVDTERRVVALEVAPNWYAVTRINLNATQPGQPLPAPLGVLLNYNVQANGSNTAPTVLASSQALSVFGSKGLFALTTAVRSTDASQTGAASPRERKFIRLGTTFLRDDPDQLTTLSVGDNVLQAATGVPGVRYGGVTWQSNFGLNPAFSTLDIPTLSDSARLPSTLEFFLNDRRVGAPVAVASGPFEISGLPTVGINGDVRVLVRDALNNERLLTVPYLHTASLYRKGLHSFSYTADLLRPDLDRYDTAFLASTHRWGVTRRLTLDGAAALSAGQRSVGAGATTVLWGQVVSDISLAISNGAPGSGRKVGTSALWQNLSASVGASVDHASPQFALLAEGEGAGAYAHPKDELRLFAARARWEMLLEASARALAAFPAGRVTPARLAA